MTVPSADVTTFDRSAVESDLKHHSSEPVNSDGSQKQSVYTVTPCFLYLAIGWTLYITQCPLTFIQLTINKCLHVVV